MIKKQKKIKAKADTTFKYLQLLNGILKLTDMEMQVLADFIDRHKKLQEVGLDINPFSTDNKKKVAELRGREDFNTLNHYIQKLRDKGAIVPTKDGYRILDILIPGDEEEIVFILNNGKTSN